MMIKFCKDILLFINEWQDKNGTLQYGEILGSLEWIKMEFFRLAKKKKSSIEDIE